MARTTSKVGGKVNNRARVNKSVASLFPTHNQQAARLDTDAERKRREKERREKERLEAEERDRLRREAQERDRRIAEDKKRREAAERDRRIAEDTKRREAEERDRRIAEDKQRREAEERDRRIAEDKARRDAQERDRRAAEEERRRAAQKRDRKIAADKRAADKAAADLKAAEAASAMEADQATRGSKPPPRPRGKVVDPDRGGGGGGMYDPRNDEFNDNSTDDAVNAADDAADDAPDYTAGAARFREVHGREPLGHDELVQFMAEEDFEESDFLDKRDEELDAESNKALDDADRDRAAARDAKIASDKQRDEALERDRAATQARQESKDAFYDEYGYDPTDEELDSWLDDPMQFKVDKDEQERVQRSVARLEDSQRESAADRDAKVAVRSKARDGLELTPEEEALLTPEELEEYRTERDRRAAESAATAAAADADRTGAMDRDAAIEARQKSEDDFYNKYGYEPSDEELDAWIDDPMGFEVDTAAQLRATSSLEDLGDSARADAELRDRRIGLVQSFRDGAILTPSQLRILTPEQLE